MGSMLSKPLGRILAGLVVVVVIMVAWFALQVDPLFHGKGKKVIVTVTQGESLSAVASAMHAKGVIASPLAFDIDTTIFGSFSVDAGSYEIAQGSSFSHIRSVFSAAPNVLPVDVTAGLTLHEVALAVANEKGAGYAGTFLAVAKQSSSPFSSTGSLEGLIGTGQYIITPQESAPQLVKHMEERFVKQAASVGLTPTTTYMGLNAYQLVIAASIVE